MRITDQQLLGLPVVTVSGDPIGKVVGFELDVDDHGMRAYLVSAAPLVTRLVGRNVTTLHINPNQVVAFDAEQMTVLDNAVHSVLPETVAKTVAI